MPKPKLYFQFELPSSVVEIVKTVCADYTRRERAIKDGNVYLVRKRENSYGDHYTKLYNKFFG